MGGGARLDFVKEFLRHDARPVRTKLLKSGCTNRECTQEVSANKPLFRKTRKAHYAVFGKTLEGRYITVVFDLKAGGVARPITGWDMDRAEVRYYRKHRGER